MLITFKTPPAPSVMMFAEHAQPILRAGGRSFPEGFPQRGVITVEQLPGVIQGIEAAMAHSDTHAPTHDPDEQDQEEQEHPMNRPVNFKQRAFPLLDLLRQAQKAQKEVMWEQADTAW